MLLFGNRLFGGNFFDRSLFDRGGSLVGRGLLFGSLSLGDRLLLLRSLGERLFGHYFFDGGSLFDSFGDLFDSLFGLSFFDSGLFGSLLDGRLFGSRGRSLFGDGFVCNDGSLDGSGLIDSDSGLVRSGNFFLLSEQLVVHDDKLLHQEHDQEVGDGIGDDGHHACPAFGHADTDPEVLNGGSDERLGDDQSNTHDHIDRKAERQIVDSGKSLFAVENVRDDLGDNVRDQIRDESCKRQRVETDFDKFAVVCDTAKRKQIIAELRNDHLKRKRDKAHHDEPNKLHKAVRFLRRLFGSRLGGALFGHGSLFFDFGVGFHFFHIFLRRNFILHYITCTRALSNNFTQYNT